MISKEQKIAEVPASEKVSRFDQVTAILFPEFSRSCLTQWIRDGFITLDGHVNPPKYKVKGGEQVKLAVEINERVEFAPEKIPLNVVYDDQSILVIDKPRDLVVHPGAGNWSGTLLNGLIFHYPELVTLPRAGIVHRLDKDTTGLMVVAKTLQAHSNLVAQLQSRDIKRKYEAIVVGNLISGGSVDKPIGRHQKNRKLMAVSEKGKEARTFYKVIRRFQDFSHIGIELDTGRTHQIRVHMAHIGHSIVGDPIYSGRSRFPKGISDALKIAISQLKRQALHANSLELSHPISGKAIHCTSKLPNDVHLLLDCLSREE